MSRSLTLEANGGKITAKKMGLCYDLRVWFNKGSISNVFSLLDAASKYRVTMESSKDPGIKVEMEPGQWMRFSLNKIGLCLFDIRCTADSKSINFNKNVNIYSLVQPVEDNENNYTSAEIKRVNEAKTLARRMGSMHLRGFSSLLNNKRIINANVASQDARRGEKINGKEIIIIRI